MPQTAVTDTARLEMILASETQFAAAAETDRYTLFESLYAAAERLVPCDAFYICVYMVRHALLSYEYCVDNGRVDTPSVLPLANGPTSWVIRNGRTLHTGAGTSSIGLRSVEFGSVDRHTPSSIHAPVLGGGQALLGVLSVQSYAPDAYCERDIHLVEWLARHLGFYLERNGNLEEREGLLSSFDECASAARATMAEVEGELIQSLHRICKEAENRAMEIPEVHLRFESGYEHIRRSCHLMETDLHHSMQRAIDSLDRLPGTDRSKAQNSDETDNRPVTDDHVLKCLSKRERDVFELVAAGRDNKTIAKALCISVNTVKFHCRNAFNKLGVHNRLQAMHMLQSQWTSVPNPPSGIVKNDAEG